jgi:hypothetical protein
MTGGAKSRSRGLIGVPIERPTSWWLAALRRRAARMHDDYLGDGPIEFERAAEREACVRFFNAAYRAEESGQGQAHELAREVRAWDPELAECLVLYGDEEGWHKELLTGLLARLGGPTDGAPRPMGRVTGTFYNVYARARHMETIMLTNLMFETIGSTTYRLALGRVKQPVLRQMLTILTRDESFHVPLNVHFIRQILRRTGRLRRLKLRGVYHLVYWALIGSSWASRRVAQDFDQVTFRELATAYAENLGRLFLHQPDLGLEPPRLLLSLLGLDRERLVEAGELDATSVASAERAVDRENVRVEAL